MANTVELDLAGRTLRLETGRLAKQADGAVLATYGDTYVLATAVASLSVKKDIDFLPLTVDYQEKAYAAGKIPGGYFRREGQPSEKEKLSSRLIDRPLRPLFPKGWYSETQVIAMVISADQSGSSDILGIIAASAALAVSNIPFNGPVGAVRVGRRDGQFLINPDLTSLEGCDLNLVVAGTADAVMMVEGGAEGLPEDVMIAAIEHAHQEIKRIVEAIRKLGSANGKSKRAVVTEQIDPALRNTVRDLTATPICQAILIPNKTARQERLDEILAEAVKALKKEDDQDRERHVKLVFHELEYTEVRKTILEDGKRADGRGPSDIRPITCEVSLLPRTHGSALFTRGETQALAVVTLGTSDDEQRIDALEGEYYRTFMLHYNFPPFSVGEARPLRSPGRREIGHGALAERALLPVVPTEEEFPYTIRLVTEILSSNGSTSMASVCGSSLAMMDAGVPIKSQVAGVVIGSVNGESAAKAEQIIRDLTGEVEVGKNYKGKVVRIMPFGAFVQIMPNQDGLVHISQLAEDRVERVEDAVNVGDEIDVKVTEVDRQGRVNLSRKAVLQEAKGITNGDWIVTDRDRGGPRREGSGGGSGYRPGGDRGPRRDFDRAGHRGGDRR